MPHFESEQIGKKTLGRAFFDYFRNWSNGARNEKEIRDSEIYDLLMGGQIPISAFKEDAGIK